MKHLRPTKPILMKMITSSSSSPLLPSPSSLSSSTAAEIKQLPGNQFFMIFVTHRISCFWGCHSHIRICYRFCSIRSEYKNHSLVLQTCNSVTRIDIASSHASPFVNKMKTCTPSTAHTFQMRYFLFCILQWIRSLFIVGINHLLQPDIFPPPLQST